MNRCQPLLMLSFFVTMAAAEEAIESKTYRLEPNQDALYQIQSRLIGAVPGDVIELSEGKFNLQRQIDIVADNITIRGRGSRKTILNFKGQTIGSQGIGATGNNFVIEGLTIQNTSGNAIKVLGSRNVTFRDVRVEWPGEPKSSNGAYGLYPVQCDNVLIENCTAVGASDAGIYVGQCRNVIIRSSRAEKNVAGIEVENTVGADVYDNIATNNAGGLLVFDLPGLQVKAGRNVRVFKNKVIKNNHRNFAAPGNIVASVPSGTGLMVMATDHVEIFDNDIASNQTSNLSIISYYISGKKISDKSYDPIPEAVSVHHNRISDGGFNPSGNIEKLLTPILGKSFPDILFDGFIDTQKLVEGKLPDELRHSIRDNGSATFVNFNLPMLTPKNVASGKYRVDRSLDSFQVSLQPLPKIKLRPHDGASAVSNPAVQVYRSAPKKLSEYGLFQGEISKQIPAAGTLPYDLNTQLFSDYTTKRRFIRLPKDEPMEFRALGVLRFPVGTIIAKTFSYPHHANDPAAGQRLLETRIEIQRANGWFGFSYLWDEDQKDATLVLGGSEIDATWIHTDGKQRTNKYQVPNANQCLACHSENKQFVPLGPIASNLNRSFDYSDGSENQLAYFKRIGAIDGLQSVDAVAALPEFQNDATGSVEQRARAWLHVNCAHCHSPLGTARTSGLDLRLSQKDPAKLGVWKSPVAAGHGSGGHDYDIVPGKPDESILIHRLLSNDPSVMMPNVSKRLIPVEGAALVKKWIAQMHDRPRKE